MSLTNVYFYCIFITWLCLIFSGSRKQTDINVMLTGLTVSVWSALLFWASFRDSGIDFVNYSSSFSGLANRVPDRGYQLIEEIFFNLGFGVYSIYLLSSILTIFTLVKYAQKLNIDIIFVFLIYMCHLAIVRDFAHVRVGIAINMFLLLLFYWGNNHFFRYLTSAVIASSIHIACVAFLIPVLLQRASLYLPSSLFFGMFICLALVVKYAMLPTFLSIIPSTRLDYLIMDGSYKNIGGLGTIFYIQLIIAIGFWIVLSKAKEVSSIARFMFFSQISGVVAIYILSDFGHLAARLGNVLFSFYPFMLLLILVEIQKHLKVEPKFLLKIILSALFVLSLYARDEASTILEATRIGL